MMLLNFKFIGMNINNIDEYLLIQYILLKKIRNNLKNNKFTNKNMTDLKYIVKNNITIYYITDLISDIGLKNIIELYHKQKIIELKCIGILIKYDEFIKYNLNPHYDSSKLADIKRLEYKKEYLQKYKKRLLIFKPNMLSFFNYFDVNFNFNNKKRKIYEI